MPHDLSSRALTSLLPVLSIICGACKSLCHTYHEKKKFYKQIVCVFGESKYQLETAYYTITKFIFGNKRIFNLGKCLEVSIFHSLNSRFELKQFVIKVLCARCCVLLIFYLKANAFTVAQLMHYAFVYFH